MSDSTRSTRAAPLLLPRRGSVSAATTCACTIGSRKSPWTKETPSIAATSGLSGSRSTPTITPSPFLPFPRPAPSSFAAAWTHPPGAAPRSTMHIPGRMRVPLDFCCSSTSLNAERETKEVVDSEEESTSPEARALTNGSERWRCSHCDDEPERDEACRMLCRGVTDQDEGDEMGVERRRNGAERRGTARGRT